MQNPWLPLYTGHLKSEPWWTSQHKLLYLRQLICKPRLTVRNESWLHLPAPGTDSLYWTGKQRTSEGASKLWLPFIFCSCCYKLSTQLQLFFIEAVAFQGEAFAKHFGISIPALLWSGWPVRSIAETAMCTSNSSTPQETTEYTHRYWAQQIFTTLNQGPAK